MASSWTEPPFSPLQVLEIFKYICYSGHLLSFIILVKLLFLGKRLNFLNICFISIFFYESVCGLFMIPNFFFVARKNWLGESDPEQVVVWSLGEIKNLHIWKRVSVFFLFKFFHGRWQSSALTGSPPTASWASSSPSSTPGWSSQGKTTYF